MSRYEERRPWGRVPWLLLANVLAPLGWLASLMRAVGSAVAERADRADRRLVSALWVRRPDGHLEGQWSSHRGSLRRLVGDVTRTKERT